MVIMEADTVLQVGESIWERSLGRGHLIFGDSFSV